MKCLPVACVLWLMASLLACAPKACEAVCRQLDTCGMLPSPLGQGEQDCNDRCEASAEVEREAIKKCIDGSSPTPQWDGAPGSCNAIDRCLRDHLPEANLSGITNLRVVPVLPGEECSTDNECASCGRLLDAAMLCQNVARVTAILVLPGGIRERSVDCLSAYSSPMTFQKVPVGTVRALWVLEGAVPAQATLVDAGAPDAGARSEPAQPATCRVYASEPGIVSAGACHPLPVALGQSASSCENTEAVCSDNQDNDGDGRIDCADPKCGPHCATPAPASLMTESLPGAAGAEAR